MQFREITGGWIRAPWYCLRRLALMTATAGSTALIAVPVSALAQDNIVATATLPRDLSPWGMYLNADLVVKAVLIGLAFASLVTWTVWLAKTIEIVICKRRVRAALNILASVRSTSEGVERLAGAEGEVRQFLDAAVTELKLSAGSIERDGIKERIASRLERIEAAYGSPPSARYRGARDHRFNRSVRGLVRHRLGDHEQLHRHFEVADHQPRGGRAGYRRGAVGDRFRACGRHSGRGDL
jgi:hypothetical protein